MPEAVSASPPLRKRLLLLNLFFNLAALGLVVIPIMAIDWPRFSAAWAKARFPDLDVLAAASPLVLAHLTAVLAALALTAVLLVGRKGTRIHRSLGWAWSLLVAAGAASGLFIHQAGGFSIFHAYSLLALVLLPISLMAARTHRVRLHAGLMVYLAVNVLLGAGFFALYPGFGGRLLVRAMFQ